MEGLTYGDMFERIDRWLTDKTSRSHHIACINAFCSTLAMSDERLCRIYNGADIVGADGMPFVWWINWTTGVKCDRFAARDTLVQLIEQSKETGYTFYLYGGAPEVVKKMKENLEAQYPWVKIVGIHSPPFRPMTEEEDDAICAEINRLKPDIISVGLGTPKQDYWIEDHIYKIPGAVFLASGAIFDFFGGRVRFPPPWVQKSGFEWLYRLLGRDFFRLLRRYTVLNVIFLWNFMLQTLRISVRQPAPWTRPEKDPV